MNKENYIHSILECCFAGFRKEIIDTATKRILEYKEPVKPVKDEITISKAELLEALKDEHSLDKYIDMLIDEIYYKANLKR